MAQSLLSPPGMADVHDAAKRSTSRTVLFLLVLNFVGTAVVAARTFVTTPHHLAEDGDPANVAASNKPGPVLTMEPFLVNLNEPEGGRFLRTQVDFEMRDRAAARLLADRERIVRDDVLRYLSNLHVSETMGEDNRLKIQSEIATRVSTKLGTAGLVRGVTFADFVVQ
jgi:flagellar basal body-associated protein FliL